MKKLIKKSFHRKEKGFTLIELLIVIVIIGILAGVLIAVINPVRQQNRARNAAVRAAVLKAAFAINTVRAGVGSLPSNSTLSAELENIIPRDTTNCDETEDLDLACQFTLSGTGMPMLCVEADDTTAVVPSTADGDSCFMDLISISNLIDGQFRIAAAAYPLGSTANLAEGDWTYYLFDSSNGLLECFDTFDYSTATDTALETAIDDAVCWAVSE